MSGCVNQADSIQIRIKVLDVQASIGVSGPATLPESQMVHAFVERQSDALRKPTIPSTTCRADAEQIQKRLREATLS